MENDYQIILYIIFGIIYFLFNLLKKKGKPATREEEVQEYEGEGQAEARTSRRETVSDPFDETVGRPKTQFPTSFEELLQEYEGGAEEANRRAEQKVRKVKEVEQEYEPVSEEESRYTEQEAAKRIRETEMRKALQEKASAAARAEVVDQRLSRQRDELLKGEEVVEKEEKRFRAYQKKSKRGRAILEILKNPEGLKNTIVATEILQRKHF